ncbi:alpha/beta hydrolase [Acuticoccus sp. MNP-M23]|uniref:alpha/beta fold hydrolase n=1 Tax=Acuticoccus sp. MNP-M23 TaxID=3072793 RepID=UPI0028168B2D|nr:alpha/beta hydrolase [Acuticoccus sp. MNP-M23]WMS43290.1 alpha/beta hydrolase [Acuticoccus sp. MNP-M23]
MTTVTMLHAVTRDRHDFAPFAATIARMNPRPQDLLGHGEAPRAPRYRLQDFAAAVRWPDANAAEASAATGTPGDGPLFYGHSLGGLVALAVAQDNPGRLRGLVLEDPPLFESRQPRLDTTPWAGGFRALKRIMTGKGRDRTLAEWEAAVALWPSGHGTQTIAEQGGTDAVARRARQIAALDPAVLDAMVDPDLHHAFDPITAIRAARCPVTILVGNREEGSALSAQDLVILAAEPSVTLVRIQSAGHYLHEARPDLCADALKALAP